MFHDHHKIAVSQPYYCIPTMNEYTYDAGCHELPLLQWMAPLEPPSSAGERGEAWHGIGAPVSNADHATARKTRVSMKRHADRSRSRDSTGRTADTLYPAVEYLQCCFPSVSSAYSTIRHPRQGLILRCDAGGGHPGKNRAARKRSVPSRENPLLVLLNPHAAAQQPRASRTRCCAMTRQRDRTSHGTAQR